ncbi:DUF1178 family protein [Zwartia vadi]|uniref:DUF1178 family protein n=1 Tax=Zwartia vadi TaxID=3058168 RepID=UPI0025B5169E|nr:DUF1178 family protein [Zwartia vadi]MDN3986710.1 DUF1178 family protein [Zwartia vadi]
MGLKVFDLQCEHGHLFEGWFGSHEDYDSQQSRGLLTCPVCQSGTIEKRLSAPRLNVGHFDAEQRAAEGGGSTGSGLTVSTSREAVLAASPEAVQLAQIQAAIMQQMRELVRNTENVGAAFAEEARRIHEGESEERPIRGTATPEEREALIEEGIAVVALPDFLDADRLQ